MSTATAAPRAGERREVAPAPAISLPRLVGVELRKAVDTRAGLWLIISIALLSIVVMVIQLATSDPEQRLFGEFFRFVQIPVGLLVPIIGILSITGEVSTRSILQSATLVPSRGRILTAKVLAVLLLTLLLVAVSAVAAALATLVGTVLGGPAEPWTVEPQLFGGIVLFQLINSLVGFALGLLLLSSPLAIVSFFVAPTVLTIVGALWSFVREPLGWIDLNSNLQGLVALDQSSLTGDQWAHIATTVAFWVVLPLVAGVVRFRRREIA